MSRGYKRANLKSDSAADSLRTDKAEVQNVKASRVYVFGDADIDEEELNNEEVELYDVRSRKKTTQTKETCEETAVIEIERDISDGDSLQNIALKYGVQVAELKRVNNLIRDQDFYALQTIKVPIKRHGLISELIEQEKKDKTRNIRNGHLGNEGASVSEDWEAADCDSDTSETRQLVVRTLSIRGGFGGSQSKEAQSFLHKMDNDIRQIVTSTCSRKDSLKQVASTLTCKSIQPLQKKSGVFGADCELSWKSVIAVMVLVAIVTPLAYFIYYVVEDGNSSNKSSMAGT